MYLSGPTGEPAIVHVDGNLISRSSVSGGPISFAQAYPAIQIDSYYHAIPGGPVVDNDIIRTASAQNGSSSVQPYSVAFEQDPGWFGVQVFASAFNQTYGSASASAYVDPYFYIPTTDPNYQDYSLVPGPGVTNSPTPGIPEPSVWTMLLAGFSALALLGGQRRAIRAASVSR